MSSFNKRNDPTQQQVKAFIPVLPEVDFLQQPDVMNNEALRQQMYEDLIDSYDKEIESELDDYIQDYRFDNHKLTDSEKLERRII